MLNLLFWTTFGLFIAVALMLTLLVLVQKGRGGGLAGALSGANVVIGSHAPRFITWMTAGVFGVFMALAIVLNLLANAR